MGSLIYYRYCHVCGHLNEKKNESISRCIRCKKPFAPFYFFKESDMLAPTEFALRPEPLPGEYAPLTGIVVVWEET